MASSWGPTTSGRAVYFTYDVTVLNNSTARVAVAAHLYIFPGWSVYGTWYQSWSGGWGAGGQNMYIGSGGDTVHTIVTASYDLPRQANDYSLSFSATAQSNTGYNSHSISVVVPKVSASVPGAPSNIAVDQASRTTLRYRFSGTTDGGSPITRWDAQRATNAAFTAGLQTVTSGGATTFTGLNPRTTYYFRSRGANAIGNGPWSSAISGATLDYPGAPSIASTGVTSTGFTINLTNPSYTGGSITERETQISVSSTFSSVAHTGSGTSTVFSTAARNTLYYVCSRVRNSQGWGSWSSTLQVRTHVTPPSAPISYAVQDIASTTVMVSQPAVSDTGGGQLSAVRAQYNTSDNETGATVTTMPGWQDVFLEDLTPGTQYYVRLAAQNVGTGGGWGPYGAWISFTTRSDVPTPPRSLTVTDVANTTATFNWATPANLYGSELLRYELRVSTSPAFGMQAQTFDIAPDVTTHPMTGLLTGTRYYIQVRAVSTNGNGSFSTIETFMTTGLPPIAQAMWRRIGGVWLPGKLWMRVGGVWRQGTLWQNVSGTWRHG